MPVKKVVTQNNIEIRPIDWKNKSDISDDEIEKIILFAKKKLSTKDLSELLSIIYKQPKKFFYTKLIKSIR